MIHVQDAIKAEILLKKYLSQDGLQDVNRNTDTYGKEYDDIKTLLTFPYNSIHRHTEAYF